VGGLRDLSKGPFFLCAQTLKRKLVRGGAKCAMHGQPSGNLTPAAGQQRGSPTASCTRALLSILQRHISSDCLQDRPNLLWQLDPSRDSRPEGTYRIDLASQSVISPTRPACTEATPVAARVPAARRCTGATPFQAQLLLARAVASMASGRAAREAPTGSGSTAQQRAACEGGVRAGTETLLPLHTRH